MVNKHVACDECTRFCEIFHRKQKDPSRIIDGFVSFIFGKNNSRTLYVPPKFARKAHLADQETQIEDSSGERWSVTLSYVDSVLAFQKGWHKFYEDHDLGDGQILVFHLIRGSHFFVQIYQRSGCEKRNFNNVRPRQKKRHRRESETVSQEEPHQTPYVNPRKKHRSPPPVATRSELQNEQTHLAVRNADVARQQICPLAVTMDDPSWMINRDNDYNRGEDRNFLYNLSSFEMEQVTPDTNKIEKASDVVISPPHTDSMEYANEFEIAAASHTGITEQTKTTEDETLMAAIHTNLVDGPAGDIVTDKFEKALDARMATSHEPSKTYEDNTNMAVIQINQTCGNSDDVFPDKFDKMFMNVANSSRPESMEQTKTIQDNTEVPAILSNQITGHSGDICTEKFHTKPSNYSILSKDVPNDVSSLHNSEKTCTDLLGKRHVMASDNQSPIVGSSKIAEGAYAVNGRSFGSLISSSVPDNPYGNRALKKELLEEVNAFPEVFYNAGKDPAIVRNYDQMSSPVVKIEPDLSNEAVSLVEVGPFSAEVKNLPYQLLQIPPMPSRRGRGRGKVVYLRGQNEKLWPVFYPNMYSVKALTDNWTSFCQYNNIKPGDELRFQLEKDEYLRFIYRVDVS